MDLEFALGGPPGGLLGGGVGAGQEASGPGPGSQVRDYFCSFARVTWPGLNDAICPPPALILAGPRGSLEEGKEHGDPPFPPNQLRAEAVWGLCLVKEAAARPGPWAVRLGEARQPDLWAGSSSSLVTNSVAQNLV